MSERKIALVSGASRGIGRAIALELARQGMDLAIVYAGNATAAEETRLAVETLGVHAQCYACDVADFAASGALIERVTTELGPVYALVNNAGMVQEATVEIKDMTLEYYETMVRNNTSSMFLMCREMVRHVLARGYGGAHIINVLSKASISSTSPGQTHYVTSKAGGMGFTKSLAAEVTKYGIHVNGILPGFVKNQFQEAEEKRDPEAYAKRMEVVNRRSPIGRIAMPIDMGYMCAMLASEKSAFCIGAMVDLTGGRLL